jgi:hypothetical protein
VLLRLFHAHELDEVTPRAHDAWCEAGLDEMGEAPICGVEVLGSDAGVLRFPWKTGLVRPARIEWRHVGVKTGYDLNDVKPFRFSVRRQRLEFLWEMQPMAQAHPPRVAEPEEGRPVEMLERAARGGDAERAMRIQRVYTGVWLHHDRAGDAMQASVGGIGGVAAKGMRAGSRRCVAHFPDVFAGPECGDTGVFSCGIGEGDVESGLVERVGIGRLCDERQLDHDVGWRLERGFRG